MALQGSLVRTARHFHREFHFDRYEMHIAASVAPYRMASSVASLEDADSGMANIIFPFFNTHSMYVQPSALDVFDIRVTDDGRNIEFSVDRYTPPPPGSTARATARLRDGRPPGVVKQNKSSGGSVDITKTRSGPRRVRMSSGERPIGAAKGKQIDTEASPPPPAQTPQWACLCRACVCS